MNRLTWSFIVILAVIISAVICLVMEWQYAFNIIVLVIASCGFVGLWGYAATMADEQEKTDSLINDIAKHVLSLTKRQIAVQQHLGITINSEIDGNTEGGPINPPTSTVQNVDSPEPTKS